MLNKVGIGTSCLPGAKLDVLEDAVSVIPDGITTGTIALNVKNNDKFISENAPARMIGVNSTVNNTEPTGVNVMNAHVAGNFNAANAISNIGIYGSGQNGTYNYGLYGVALGGSSSNNCGVYGQASGGTSSVNWAGILTEAHLQPVHIKAVI